MMYDMGNRKYLKRASLIFDANFYYHYKNNKLVALSVEGLDLPVNGYVSAGTFKILYKQIKEMEAKKGVKRTQPARASNVERVYDKYESAQKPFISDVNAIYKAVSKISCKQYKMTTSEYWYNYLPNC